MAPQVGLEPTTLRLTPVVGFPRRGDSFRVADYTSTAGAHSNDEPTASRGAQRRPTLQEEVVVGARTGATGVVPVGSLGEPAPKRSTGVAGSAARISTLQKALETADIVREAMLQRQWQWLL